MIGRPLLGLPMTTILVFGLLASFSVASMPFHSRSWEEMPAATIFWKSAMPWASMRFRSASYCSFWRTNFICSASCSRRSFSWMALATTGGRPILRRSTC